MYLVTFGISLINSFAFSSASFLSAATVPESLLISTINSTMLISSCVTFCNAEAFLFSRAMTGPISGYSESYGI
ncbi:hypothetical protein BX070DRAFT_224832, partial [Coemansia spiralis]